MTVQPCNPDRHRHSTRETPTPGDGLEPRRSGDYFRFPPEDPVARPLSVAILDLNNGTPNQGIFCIQRILDQFAETLRDEQGIGLTWKRYDVRVDAQVPGLDEADVVISSGG